MCTARKQLLRLVRPLLEPPAPAPMRHTQAAAAAARAAAALELQHSLNEQMASAAAARFAARRIERAWAAYCCAPVGGRGARVEAVTRVQVRAACYNWRRCNRCARY